MNPEREHLKRISVVGTSGSGKTTVSKKLAALLSLKYCELDAIFHLPNWQERPLNEFREIVTRETSKDEWVIDGNYQSVRDIVWSRATAVIWLNLPFRVVFSRMFLRIFKRRNQILWNTNRESLIKHFISKDSMLYWVIKTHSKRKKEYSALFRSKSHTHLHKLEFRNQKVLNRYLFSLETAANKPAIY